MHITVRLNNDMRHFIIFCILTFLVGFISGKVIAQASDTDEVYWAAKPIQCGPLKQMFEQMQDKGHVAAFGGLGIAHSENFDNTFNVFNFLSVNMEDNTWIMIEVNAEKTMACAVAYGTGVEFNPKQLKEFTGPDTYNNPEFFK